MPRQTKISLHAPRGIQAAKHGLRRKESCAFVKILYLRPPVFEPQKRA